MTDQPSTQVDDVFVVGQRRRPGGAFPSGGGGGDEGGTQEGALGWDADAAAAAAATEFARLAAAAGEDGLNHRERGAFLYRNADGSIRVVNPEGAPCPD